MLRRIEPEWLDRLPATDPRAQRTRRDLRLINVLMANAAAVSRTLMSSGVLRDGIAAADLGAGDGHFMLRVARKLTRVNAELILVDRADAVAEETLAALRALGWRASACAMDALAWLRRTRTRFDVMTANLFLHHFEPAALRELLALAAERTRVFVACEPRRSRFALGASALLGVLGCGPETRSDALISVRAGFLGNELSQAWPRAGWDLSETEKGLFSHLFVAKRRAGL